MSEIKPVRLQLSRKKGFNLQQHSMSVNGLPAVNCARPSKWGNPAAIGSYFKVGDPNPKTAGLFKMAWCIALPEYADSSFTYVANASVAVRLHQELSATGFYDSRIGQLTGKNIYCWCKVGEPCHGDTLLSLASGWKCEEVNG